MGGKHRIFDDMANDLAARQFAGIQVTPFGEQLTRYLFIPVVERVPNVGEIVAELAKTECEIKHRHIPGKGQQHVDLPQQPVHQQRSQRRDNDRKHPGDPAVVRLARIQTAMRPTRPSQKTGINPVGASQRTGLLQDQCKQDGKKAHAKS